MTHTTGMGTMNESDLKNSVASQEADMLALIRELSAMASRLNEELRVVREDVAELREGRAPA